MRKIIWGIAIVFCVQVGFQLAMTANRSNNDYASLRTPLQNGIDVQAASLSDDDLDTNIAPVAPETLSTDPQIQTRILIRYVRVPEYRAQTAPPTTNAFKPVVITYDRTGALTGGSAATAERHSTVRTETPSSDDKRSLVAKVVTKPYDWLKAVGSKLR
jgi:hypothetical protein